MPSWHWVVDELLTALRREGASADQMAERLRDVYRDEGHDMIVRDYALQHLGHLLEEGGDRTVIGNTLSAATGEKAGTLAGTALLALNHAGKAAPTADRALLVAADTAYDLRSRITAMQVAGKQGNQAALPLAASIAADEAAPVPLRMSALATLADLHATGQRPLLQELANSTDPRIQSAAGAALAAITEK